MTHIETSLISHIIYCNSQKHIICKYSSTNAWGMSPDGHHRNYTYYSHDDVIKWKHFPCYGPFVWGIHRSLVKFTLQRPWRGALMFFFICAWTNDWANNRGANDLRRHRAHYDSIVMGNKSSLASHCNSLNSLRPRWNGRHFADDIFKYIFLNENVWIPTKISLKFVPKGPINDIPALVQKMAWRRPGDKPLYEPMLASLPTYICATRPQ